MWIRNGVETELLTVNHMILSEEESIAEHLRNLPYTTPCSARSFALMSFVVDLGFLGRTVWRNVSRLLSLWESTQTCQYLQTLSDRNHMDMAYTASWLTFIRQCASAWSCTGLFCPGVQTSKSRLKTPGTEYTRFLVYCFAGLACAYRDHCSGSET